jgi:TetR/AcrR family transcriptional regulator
MSVVSAQSTTRETILRETATLFAMDGYSGVSMRDIANAAGITPAALYHHFRDKSELYRATMEFAFGSKMSDLPSILFGEVPIEERFVGFIAWFCNLMATDVIYARLMQREMLDGDEERLHYLTEEVFRAPFSQTMDMMAEIAPKGDRHQLAVLVFGIIFGYFAFTPTRQLQPGYRPEHDEPDLVANAVAQLVLNGLKSYVKVEAAAQ